MKNIFSIQDLKSRLEDLKSGRLKNVPCNQEVPLKLTEQEEHDLYNFVNNIIPKNRVYQKFKCIEI